MPLGFIGKHINKIKHISCSPIFQSCLYYAMQSVMLVCQHKGVSRKKAEMFSWLIHAAQYCSMYLVTNTLYSLLPWIEGVTTFFYSPSIHGGQLLAPFTRMQHLLLCLLTSLPPSSLAACTDRYSQSMHVLSRWYWRSCAFYLWTEGVTDKISLHDSTGIKILILLSLFHSGSKYF